MGRQWHILTGGVCLALWAAGAQAERVADPFGPRTPPAQLRPTAWGLEPPELYLARRTPQPFLDERRTLSAAVVAAVNPAAHARALSDLAEFHLAHGMAAEGLSLLAGLSDGDMPPAHRLRAAALELALGVIDTRPRPLTDRARALLDPRHRGWADQPLFAALDAIRDGRPGDAGPWLEDAVTRLARFPKPVQERALPGLLEAAIETRQWVLARDLAAAFEAFPALAGTPAYHYLLGRAAQAGDESVAAFDSYVRAMGGGDLYAHRARRAIVEMGLDKAALSPAEAVELLEVESNLWRGDASAAEVLNDLASLLLVEGDQVGAIETYGHLIAQHPDAPQAHAARQKARALVAKLYEAGAGGLISLSEFMAAHDRIARLFRFDPNFADPAEAYADMFRATGATTIAALEYETIHDYLAVAEDLGLVDLAPGRLAGLRIKQAGALLAGGQYDVLAPVLDRGLTGADGAQQADFALIAARYRDETGQPVAPAGEGGDPSPQMLALRARALFDQGDWAAAEAAYAELWAQEGEGLAFPQAVNFLLATYRNGNMAQAAALAEEFPSLTTLPGWAGIAAGLSQSAPALLPLRADTARARIENAREVLDRLPSVGTGTN